MHRLRTNRTELDNVRKMQGFVSTDRQLKMFEIAERVGISKQRVGHMLHELLGMKGCWYRTYCM